MSAIVKPSLSANCRKGLLIATFLLLTILFTSLIIYTSTIINVKPSLEGAVHVNSEKKLRTALENTPNNKQHVIILDKDITLTDGPINIGKDKDILLTSNRPFGFYKLIGATEGGFLSHSHIYLDYPTIVVDGGGVLRLDGVIVTHVKGIPGEGVRVGSNGTFIMYDGEISGNSHPASSLNSINYIKGGVINNGVFEMYGGKITNNIAKSGGGVYNTGNFTMHGGTISNNKADYGGGICLGMRYLGDIEYIGNFTMHGGTISNNKADYGGGVYTDRDVSHGDFTMCGGTISNNHANEMDNNVSGPFKWLGGEIYDNTEDNINTDTIENDTHLFYVVICVISIGVIIGVVTIILFLHFKQHKINFKQNK